MKDLTTTTLIDKKSVKTREPNCERNLPARIKDDTLISQEVEKFKREILTVRDGLFALSSKEFTPSMVKKVIRKQLKVSNKTHTAIDFENDLPMTHQQIKREKTKIVRETSGAVCFGFQKNRFQGTNTRSLREIKSKNDQVIRRRERVIQELSRAIPNIDREKERILPKFEYCVVESDLVNSWLIDIQKIDSGVPIIM